MDTGKNKLTTLERFEEKVDPIPTAEGCLLWKGARNPKGQGKFNLNGHDLSVTRAAWELAYGQPVPEGRLVVHSCTNELCVNPDHLWLGTSKHKAEDKVQGEKNGRAKLTTAEVREIKQRLARGEQVCYRDYGVSRKTIFNIKRGYRWQHVVG